MMSRVDWASTIDAYFVHHRLATSPERVDRLKASESFWAWEAIQEAVTAPADDVVELLVAMADAAVTLEELAFLGADAIEDLLWADAPRHVEAIDAAARTNERLRIALRCAWYEGHVSPEIAIRLRRFGDPL